MAYVLRFVQRFRVSEQAAFLELENQFAELERRSEGWPRGRRMRPLSGREPGNTLIWECEFPTLEDVHAAIRTMDASPDHARLFAMQSPMMLDAWTEIHEVLCE
ncbi:MAG TPA: hypothetical protein VLE22_25075, partial [Bryobacteraceae bacterium]|nr:hypothetical protein [Bryobacteraceae bacterium]